MYSSCMHKLDQLIDHCNVDVTFWVLLQGCTDFLIWVSISSASVYNEFC